jgi:hypothetical protein
MIASQGVALSIEVAVDMIEAMARHITMLVAARPL